MICTRLERSERKDTREVRLSLAQAGLETQRAKPTGRHVPICLLTDHEPILAKNVQKDASVAVISLE